MWRSGSGCLVPWRGAVRSIKTGSARKAPGPALTSACGRLGVPVPAAKPFKTHAEQIELLAQEEARQASWQAALDEL